MSHSCADLLHVELVRRQIEALGVDVYLAEHDLRPGTSIAAKVLEAIGRCDALVVLITGNSIDSVFVQQEVGIARAFGRPIIPIVERGVDVTRLGILREVEYLELDLEIPAEAMAKVSASLTVLVASQAPTRPPVPVPVGSLQVTQPGEPPVLPEALVVLGLGLLLGFLIISMANGGGSPGAT